MTAHPCPGAQRARLRALLALVLSLCAATGLTAQVAYAEDFVAPSDVASLDGPLAENEYVTSGRAPQVVSAPDGTAYAAWLAPGAGGQNVAMLATRAPGGTWKSEIIAPAFKVSGGVPLGRASDGTLTALIVDPTNDSLNAWTRPPGGTFTKQATLSTDPRIASIALAVNASGSAVAAWRASVDGTKWIAIGKHRSGPATWDNWVYGLTPTNFVNVGQLPTPAFSSDPSGTPVKWEDVDPLSVAINDAGVYAYGAAVPTAATGSTMETMVFRSKSTPGQLSGWVVKPPTAGLHQSRVRVALSSTGELGATWLDASPVPSTFEVNKPSYGVVVGANFGSVALNVTTPAAVPIGFTNGTDFTLLWTQGNGSLAGRLVYGTASVSDASISASSQLSPSSDAAWAPTLVTDASGRRLALWANLTTSTIQGRLSLPGETTFHDIRTINPGAGFSTAPAGAFDAEGNAAVAWTRKNLSASTLQATGLDAAPPAFDQVLFPTSGNATTPLAFGASARDVWSTPKIHWSFGDGAGADGAQAAHAYGSPNSYTASVSATDDVGNSVSRSAVVPVSSVPPVDADRDGFLSDRDCNDTDGRVHPTAHDVPGNKVDEDCDGRDAAYGTLVTTVDLGFRRSATRLQITTLAVRGVRVGDRIKVRCSGDGCTRKPNVERRVKKVNKQATYDLLELVKGLRLRPGARLTISVSRDEYTSRVWTMTARKGQDPKKVTTCQVPGSKKAVACN